MFLGVKSIYGTNQHSFFVCDNEKGKSYDFDNIIIYKDGKILIRYRNQWADKALFTGNFDFKMKIKPNLNLDTPYLLRKSGAFSCSYDFYVPADVIKMTDVEYCITRDEEGRACRVYRKCTISLDGDHDIYVEEGLKWMSSDTYNIEHEARMVLSKMSSMSLDDFDEVEKSFKKLKSLNKQYLNILESFKNYTIEDYFASIQNGEKEEES